MPDSFRAKLTLDTVARTQYGAEIFKFMADYTGSQEDNSFSAATPMASAELYVSNPALLGVFNPSDKFDVYFKLIPKAVAEKVAELTAGPVEAESVITQEPSAPV